MQSVMGPALLVCRGTVRTRTLGPLLSRTPNDRHMHARALSPVTELETQSKKIRGLVILRGEHGRVSRVRQE